MTHVIYSFGRCGSTLLAQLIAASLYTQNTTKSKVSEFKINEYVHHDNNSNLELLQNQKVIHTHQLYRRYDNIIKNSTMVFCTRRDIVETISSLMIAQHSRGYNFSPGEKNSGNAKKTPWRNIPKNKLTMEDSVVQKLILSYYSFIKIDYPQCKQHNPKSHHLLYYEDWIYDFSKLSFLNLNYDQELNFKLTKKIPIDKHEWVNYGVLIDQVKRFNNGSTQIEIQ